MAQGSTDTADFVCPWDAPTLGGACKLTSGDLCVYFAGLNGACTAYACRSGAWQGASCP